MNEKSPLNDDPKIVLEYEDGTRDDVTELEREQYEEFLELTKRIRNLYSATLKMKEMKDNDYQ